MNDNQANTPRDVTWRPAGTGLAITRRCSARRGQWLCGARVSFRGLCAACAKERAEREAARAAA